MDSTKIYSSPSPVLILVTSYVANCQFVITEMDGIIMNTCAMCYLFWNYKQCYFMKT